MALQGILPTILVTDENPPFPLTLEPFGFAPSPPMADSQTHLTP